MRKASACKTTDGYMPAVEYDDGTMRIIDFTVFPDDVSAATRAKEIEDGGFAQAKLNAEGVIRRQAQDYAAHADDFRSHRPELVPEPAPSVPHEAWRSEFNLMRFITRSTHRVEDRVARMIFGLYLLGTGQLLLFVLLWLRGNGG